MKKEKKIKTELDHLKSIDSSLLTIALLLMCIIAIVAIATVGIYSRTEVTANAAAENLLSEPITFNEYEKIILGTIGLEAGKTYKLAGTYTPIAGAEPVPYEMNITPVEYYHGYYLPIAEAEGFDEDTKAETKAQTEGIICLTDDGVKLEVEQDGTIGTYSIYIYDKTNEINDTPIYEANSCLIIVDAEGRQDTEGIAVYPFVINNITECGASDSATEDLSAGTIVENITGSFTTFLTGTGDGIVNFFDTIFTKEDGGISVLGIVALSMMGLGIATGVIKFLLSKAS